MIVATAGHIDHGKTSLVRAITGVDTDRLPEEKARGISIDLGFAYWPQQDGSVIGFVDVPGHERFVRNMLAGVCGVDCAMVVIAADDGVMPQTIEHLRILDLLGVARGIAVLSKIDRVDGMRLAEVRADVQTLLASTGLAKSPVMDASAVSGLGVEEIKHALVRVARELCLRSYRAKHFRFIIDRAFTVGGSGTIVTGTVVDGVVSAGDHLRISPRGMQVRVRGLQVAGGPMEQVCAGQRCAINITGAAVSDVRRGHWLLSDVVHAPTSRLDVELHVLPDREHPLPHGAQVHLHIGAGEMLARVAIAGGASVPRGATTVAQLVLEAPVAALHGDRFVIRDASARQTLGGGHVLDPFARPLRRSPEQRKRLEALRCNDAEQALRQLLALDGAGVDLQAFETMFNLTRDAALELYRRLDAVVIGDAPRIAVPRSRCAAIANAIMARLAAFHEQEPTLAGMPIAALRRDTASFLSAATFTALMHNLAAAQGVIVAGALARLRAHDVSASAADRQLWERIYPLLLEAGATAPTVPELAAEARCDARALRDMLYRRRSTGGVWRVGNDRFYLRATFASLAASAGVLALRAGEQGFTAAEFRDAIGTGRTLAIEILESLDAAGITIRVGDRRRLQRDFVPVLGPAPPVAPRRGLPARKRNGQPQTHPSPQPARRSFAKAKRNSA